MWDTTTVHTHAYVVLQRVELCLDEGWNFNFGNAAVNLIQHTYRVHIFTDPRCTPQSYVEHVPSDEGVA